MHTYKWSGSRDQSRVLVFLSVWVFSLPITFYEWLSLISHFHRCTGVSWGDSGHPSCSLSRVIWAAGHIELWKMTWEAAVKLVSCKDTRVCPSGLEILRLLISSKTGGFQGSSSSVVYAVQAWACFWRPCSTRSILGMYYLHKWNPALYNPLDFVSYPPALEFTTCFSLCTFWVSFG